MADPVAPWFRAGVADGLAALYALHLPGHPAADVLTRTADVWEAALWPDHAWDSALDPPRIAAAFRSLCRHSDRWPCPAQFLAHLPARRPPVRLTWQLSDEQRRANQQRIRELAASSGRRR
jgi:hypothetical protein